MNNQIVIYITLVLLGGVLHGFLSKLTEGFHMIFVFGKKSLDKRVDIMNVRANKLTHTFIREMVQLSVKLGARPDFALERSCNSILDAARQISEQMDARET